MSSHARVFRQKAMHVKTTRTYYDIGLVILLSKAPPITTNFLSLSPSTRVIIPWHRANLLNHNLLRLSLHFLLTSAVYIDSCRLRGADTAWTRRVTVVATVRVRVPAAWTRRVTVVATVRVRVPAVYSDLRTSTGISRFVVTAWFSSILMQLHVPTCINCMIRIVKFATVDRH